MQPTRTNRPLRPICATTLAALTGLAFTWTSHAQPEQWLEYHTGNEPQGYRWLELGTNPPPNVVLPKLEGLAYFGVWKNGLETNDGRRFCLDRAAKSGPYDRLVFDANGNGRLDDDPVVKCSRRQDSMAYFEPAKLVFKGEDGPISYHLIARFYQFGTQRAQLLIGSGGWYEGKVALAGKKRTVRLIDNTVNGVFNDRSESASDCDRIVVDGEEGLSRYLGKYLEVDDRLLALEVAPDGAFIKVKPAEGVVFGAVRVPETITEFTAMGGNGHFVRKPQKGEFKLPVGKYRVQGWEVTRKDDKGAAWKLSGYSFTKAGDFAVAAEEPAKLVVGEPVRAVLQATEVKSEISFGLRLLGPLGETVDIMRGEERPRAPRIHIASQTGTFRSTNTFEYG